MKVRHAAAFFVTLLVAEFLLGLWHGAAWTFGFFGIYHGLMIWAYYTIRNHWGRMPVFLQVILTFHVVCGGWLIFRATSMGQAAEMFHSLLYSFQVPELTLSLMAIEILALIGILFAVQVFQHRQNDTFVVLRLPAYARYAFFALMASLMMAFGNFQERPFIYFQF